MVDHAKEEGMEIGEEKQLMKVVQNSLDRNYLLQDIADVNELTLGELKDFIKKHDLEKRKGKRT